MTARWLTTLAASDVEALLRRRPDVMAEPRPDDLRDLAARLDDPWSVADALQVAPLPCLQVAEALQALGGRADGTELTAFLEAGEEALHRRAVDDAVTWLAERAVVRQVDDSLEASPALATCMPEPLGLGSPLAQLVPGQTAVALKRTLGALGRSRDGNKAALVAATTAALSDADLVRAVASTAPPPVGDWIARRAHAVAADDEDVYDPAAYRMGQEALRWGLQHGLLLSLDYGYAHRMPAEVALALRGQGWRAPFAPQEPSVTTHPVTVEEVARESAAAAAAFAAHSTSVLDHVARCGVPTLKSGGIGARELTRLARATGAGEDEVRMVLVLAAACDLLEESGRAVVVGDGFGAWRDDEPADRYMAFLEAWWQLGGFASRSRNEDGKAVPVLDAPLDCAACAAGRHALLTTLSSLAPTAATEPPTVGPAVSWARPLAHAGSAQGAPPFQDTWREAEQLGVVARGTLSALGRCLVAADGAGIRAVAEGVLPGTSDEAVFGADLTVMVVGAPSARVSALLDGCADRESRGGAVVWRVTPESLRRALDQGITADGLRTDLGQVSRGDLPQPLRYLIDDLARRHGSVRARSVACCLRSDDQALLAEIAVDRRLKRLGLQVLAPTVLASDAGVDETVAALRGAGFLPMAEDRAGVVALGRAKGRDAGAEPAAARRSRRARTPAPRAKTVDVAAFAAGLVHAGVPDHEPPASGTERSIAAHAPRLPSAQRRLLAHAIDHGSSVLIEYISSTGGRTERRIGEMLLAGNGLFAWCELRQDDRNFTLSRILSVRPVG